MYNKGMNTTRTIIHPDGHTDIETYLQDADGVWMWAVTQCNGGTMELKDVRECDVNGTQVIICDVLETGAVLPHSILLDEYLNPTWEQDADSVFGFLKAAEATEYVQPEYKEAQQVSDKFNFDTVTEQEF